MTVADELFKIANSLETQGKLLQDEEFSKPLQLLTDAAEEVGKAWSGSWLGYHSRVYYAGLTEPPPGAHFSQELGMKDGFPLQETIGNWMEYRFDDVVSAIQKQTGEPSTNELEERSSSIKEEFEEVQSRVLSILSGILNSRKDDKYLCDIAEKVEGMKLFGANNFIEVMRPSGRIMSRDRPAIQAGLHTPPHISILAQVLAMRYPFTACDELSKLSRRAASHIQNIEKHKIQSDRVGTNVFIGHGRSSVWKDVKDFIQDRMHLPWDEFNRVPIAGFTNIRRLSQMLDEAAIAFLIMTAEDEQADGKQYARQNVIHEAGLFQGRLGFERAIILLEEGCEEFSNVQGLGQIRFPSGNISAVFEDIRRVLEREVLVDER
jgi:predicted nucleotide-binding protein